MSKYTVTIGYHEFGFDDGNTAISFAELAKSHFVPSKYDASVSVSIIINNEFCEEVDDNDND